jgi:hypothetical protein
MHIQKRFGYFFKILLTIVLVLGIRPHSHQVSAETQALGVIRRVNIPYSAPGAPYPSHAIFWLGKVDRDHNYSDVRVIYYDSAIKFTIHTIDRLHWTDTTPTAPDIKEWDAVSIYLNTTNLLSSTPQTTTYRFDIALGDFYAIYVGNGTGWTKVNLPATITTSWRGAKGPNSGVDAKGWQADLLIPFSSLGLSTKPTLNTIWGLAVEVHDRDDANGTLRYTKTWPETMQPDNPSTWGELSFGWKPINIPRAIPTGKMILRNGLNYITVKDSAVGGHTTCGSDVDHWTEWGNTPRPGYGQINIQNQWDVSDWPCFSKFFITFPLDTIPQGKTIISARLTMTLFGNAGGGDWGEPPISYIQVLSVSEDWNEATLTWNNAPMAKENIVGAWVKPRDYDNFPYYETYSWEVREAFIEAYLSGQPLRLAMYSADGERHTGKYFWSSDSTEWGGTIRPTLEVIWGEECSKPSITCYFSYLPSLNKK